MPPRKVIVLPTKRHAQRKEQDKCRSLSGMCAQRLTYVSSLTRADLARWEVGGGTMRKAFTVNASCFHTAYIFDTLAGTTLSDKAALEGIIPPRAALTVKVALGGIPPSRAALSLKAHRTIVAVPAPRRRRTAARKSEGSDILHFHLFVGVLQHAQVGGPVRLLRRTRAGRTEIPQQHRQFSSTPVRGDAVSGAQRARRPLCSPPGMVREAGRAAWCVRAAQPRCHVPHFPVP